MRRDSPLLRAAARIRHRRDAGGRAAARCRGFLHRTPYLTTERRTPNTGAPERRKVAGRLHADRSPAPETAHTAPRNRTASAARPAPSAPIRPGYSSGRVRRACVVRVRRRRRHPLFRVCPAGVPDAAGNGPGKTGPASRPGPARRRCCASIGGDGKRRRGRCRCISPTNSSGSSATMAISFLPEVFEPAETELLLHEAHEIFACSRREVVRERNGRTARTAFAAHRYNEAYRRPRPPSAPRSAGAADPRRRGLHAPVQDQRQGRSFDGDVWQWHQDYGVWVAGRRDAGVPGDERRPVPRGGNGVQRRPHVHPPAATGRGSWRPVTTSKTTSYPLWTIDNTTITRLVEEGGLVAPKGRAGSLVMFSGNLVHGSPSNMSPFDRTIVYLSLCRVDNHIRRFPAAGNGSPTAISPRSNASTTAA